MLFIERGFMVKGNVGERFQILSANPQIRNQKILTNSSNIQIQSQNMVGRKGDDISAKRRIFVF